MSRALSANIIAGKDGSSTPVYLLQLESNTTTYRWATLPTADFHTTWTGTAFLGNRLADNGFSRIKDSCDVTFGGNAGEVSGFTFKLLNQDNYGKTLKDAGEVFDNKSVELRLIFADKTSPSWANADPRFVGYIDDWYWDESYIYFVCRRSWMDRHKDRPARELTKAEFDGLPDSVEGDAIPIIIGDFTRGPGINRSGLASNISPGGSQIIHRDYFRGILLQPIQSFGNDSSDNPRALLCGHDMHTPIVALQDLYKFYWDDTRKCWARNYILFDGTESFGSFLAGCTTQSVYREGSSFFRNLLRLIPVEDTVNSTGATNVGYAVDEDDSNYALLDADGEIASYRIPSIFGKGNPQASVAVVFRVDASSRVDDTCQLEIYDESGVSLQAFTNIAGYGSFQSVDITSLLSTAEGDYTGLRIRFKYHDVSGHDAGCELRVRSVFLSVVEKTEVPGDYIYTTGKGRMYGDWIDDADHLNDHDEDDLIENAAYAIESFLVEELGLEVGAEIETYDGYSNSHGVDRVGLNREAWKIARQYLEKQNTREIFRDIAREFGFAYFQRYNGKETVCRIDALGAPAVIDESSILVKGNETTFKVRRTKFQDVKNEFVLKYRQNYATGEYENQLYVLRPDQGSFSADYTNLASQGQEYWTKCHSAYSTYGIVNRWTLEAKHIRDATTAELALKFYIDWLTRRPFICEFDAALDQVGLELMQCVKISHRLLPNDLDGDVSGANLWRLIDMEFDANLDEMHLKFLDVGKYSFIPPSFILPRHNDDGSVTYLQPKLILDADDLIGTYAKNDDVTAWADTQSPDLFEFIEDAGSPKPPTFDTDVFNGHAAVKFSGDNYLIGNSVQLGDLIDADEYTMFVVCQIDDLNSNEATVSDNEAIICDDTATTFGVFLKSGGTAHIVNNDGTEDSANIGFDAELPILLLGTHDSSSNLKINQNIGDDEIASSGTSGTTTSVANGVRIGMNAAGTHSMTGSIGLIVIFPYALTTAEQQWVADYLRTKYGLY